METFFVRASKLDYLHKGLLSKYELFYCKGHIQFVLCRKKDLFWLNADMKHW